MRLGFATGLLLAAAFAFAAAPAPDDSQLKQGEYIYRAAGCETCHTDSKHAGKPLAGGHPLATPFGTFYTPNITPDKETGIGRWSEQDFVRAMRFGMSPDGDHYYPAFPYPSYTKLSDDDIRALWTYLKARAPIMQANRQHDLKWFARSRSFLGIWKRLYFTPGAYQPDANKSQTWNRGVYLSEAAAHCGECHTPRNFLGGIKSKQRYAGTRAGPDGGVVPNITPDKNTGIGKWRASELADYLATGLTPEGDSAGDLMAEVIDNGLKYLSKEDLAAIAEHVLSQPPVENAVRKPKKPGQKESLE